MSDGRRHLWVTENATLFGTLLVFGLFALRLNAIAGTYAGELMRTLGPVEIIVGMLLHYVGVLVGAVASLATCYFLLRLATITGPWVRERPADRRASSRDVTALAVAFLAAWFLYSHAEQFTGGHGGGFLEVMTVPILVSIAYTVQVFAQRRAKRSGSGNSSEQRIRVAVMAGALAVGAVVLAGTLTDKRLWLPYEELETTAGYCEGYVLASDAMWTTVFRNEPQLDLAYLKTKTIKVRDPSAFPSGPAPEGVPLRRSASATEEFCSEIRFGPPPD